MTDVQQRAAAKHFVEYWKGKGYEKGESQKFWLSLLADVFGVDHVAEYISFEDQVHLDHTSFIDGFIPSTKVLIEQKSLGKSLTAPIPQSDGSLLSPLQQAQRYVHALLDEKGRQAIPRWVVTCNFEEFRVYDLDHPQNETQVIKLENLPDEYYRLKFLVDTGDENLKREMELSLKAGELVGKIHDRFLEKYHDPMAVHTQRSLNILCVRLVFCLYAEDAGLFGAKDAFSQYVAQYEPKDIRRALIDLFKVLDTPLEERADLYLSDELAAFPYVNGGLFKDENIVIPQITDELKTILIESARFDWSKISPTIFGAVFESTLNPETRRSGGMHYTSIENIHKVIDPLFLNDLKEELTAIKEIAVQGEKTKKLKQYQQKLADMTFLDPACGSGNFLTETYVSLRRLENEVLLELHNGQLMIANEDTSPIKVSISQFYGIEINDFAVTVAKTALWIAESQMMKETEDVILMPLDFLPLKTNANIVEGNALLMDWNRLRPAGSQPFIQAGNPPFLGARLMQNSQKQDVLTVFGSKWKNVGNLDYVCCWYKKATDMMLNGNAVKTALVSTNSVCQGETVANLWKPLMEAGVHIDFAHRTFVWDSEATNKAHVHCVVVGFSTAPSDKERIIYSNGQITKAKNINAYLLDAEDIFVENQSTPICKNAPKARSGNKPIDNGFYLFSQEEMEEFIEKEPQSAQWFRPWVGSYEYINNVPRYCLWLGECPPEELIKMPECLKRVQAVRDFRLESKSAGTVKLADKPTHFHVETILDKPFLVLPLTSSERRRYVPIGFLTPDYLASNLVVIIANATIYDFGVLTSNVFMSWMRAVCGRLKSDYRITKDNVYNNFPWPEPTDAQKAKIEQTAQAILDARAKYTNSSLADMYGSNMYLFSELLTAHQNNDRAVMEAYGFWGKLNSESECVAELMKRYQSLAAKAEG